MFSFWTCAPKWLRISAATSTHPIAPPPVATPENLGRLRRDGSQALGLDGGQSASGLQRLRPPRRPSAKTQNLQCLGARQPRTQTPHPRRQSLPQRCLGPSTHHRLARRDQRPMANQKNLPHHEITDPALCLILTTFREMNLRG